MGNPLYGDKNKPYPERYPLGIVDQHIMQQEYSGPETVQRARSMLQRKDYSALFNNSEHFATWCKYGVRASDQAERIAIAGVGGGVAVGGVVAGAAIGSVVPGVGTAVGAAIGGAIGAIAGLVGGGGGAWAATKFLRNAEARDDKGHVAKD